MKWNKACWDTGDYIRQRSSRDSGDYAGSDSRSLRLDTTRLHNEHRHLCKETDSIPVFLSYFFLKEATLLYDSSSLFFPFFQKKKKEIEAEVKIWNLIQWKLMKSLEKTVWMCKPIDTECLYLKIPPPIFSSTSLSYVCSLRLQGLQL